MHYTWDEVKISENQTMGLHTPKDMECLYNLGCLLLMGQSTPNSLLSIL